MDRADQFIPHLIVSDGLAAVAFYKKLFGAEEGHRMMAADGKRLMHGEIVLDGHKVFLSDQFEADEGGTLKSPQALGGTCVRITIEVEDADGLVERAVAAGARVLMPVQDLFGGTLWKESSIRSSMSGGINQQLKEQTDEETHAPAKSFSRSRSSRKLLSSRESGPGGI